MSQTRREFIATAATVAAAAALGQAQASGAVTDRISLAAWSLNRSFFYHDPVTRQQASRWKNLDLPKIAREEFGITGLEFVNQFFENPTLSYLNQLRRQLDTNGVTPVLIMVDEEGDMASADKKVRLDSAIAHRKWVDIAQYLGCRAIRCNLGAYRIKWQEDKELVSRAAESFSDLLDYAKGSGLYVLIENHGGASSDPEVLVSLMKTVNNPKFGVLPDFGNINRGDDNAEVIRKIVPWAKVSISVKAAWATDDTNPGWDLEKIIGICRESGYHGFWGIESSYGRAPKGQPAAPRVQMTLEDIWAQEAKGVKLTKAAIEKTVLKA